MSAAFDQLPITRANRPYLPRIDYSADDLTSLRERLPARLSEVLPHWNPALAQDGSDYGVLLTQLFAQMAAVLYAYADQRANESYLCTATLTRSLIDLAQLIDYRLGPGASASVLQAFIAKTDKSGSLPAAFKLNALPGGNAPALVYETATVLDVQPSRNTMRLFGYNRSTRVLQLRAHAGDTQDTSALLDALYSGMKAGVPVVFDDGATLCAVPVAAITTIGAATQISWAAGIAAQDHNYPLADLTLHGRPQQTAKLAAAARADEITIGQTVLPMLNVNKFSVGDAVLVDSAGLQFAATVLHTALWSGHSPAGNLTLSRGMPASLRRSATRVLLGRLCGHHNGTLSAGTTQITLRSETGLAAAAPGDMLLLVDAAGVEMATVASVITSARTFTLAQPLLRAMRPAPIIHIGHGHGHGHHAVPSIALYVLDPNNPAAPQSPLRPMLLSEVSGVFSGGHTVLTLDKSVDAFAMGSVVALGDGSHFSAHSVLANESVDDATQLTLSGSAPAEMRVATLNVYGAFAASMHVAGYNKAESSLAAGASQLDIAGTPVGLAPGLDLVIADGTSAEGTRITQVLTMADRVRISLARALDFSYALGDAVVYGNVVQATHGASAPDEVLGSGDPTAAPQRFTLRRSPLAWLADAAAPRGVSPAVEVLIGGEAWTRVETLADSGPLDRHWVIDIDEAERASVVFGDGVNGAAPPSGRNNIVARYRSGHGTAANVAAQAISKMPQTPDYVSKSFNPLPASGGADREDATTSRTQARACVRTLDRAVSLSDYADLALTCAGVGKAMASIEREGSGAGARRVITVTCAAVGGNALSTPQKEALLAYLQARSPEPDRIRIRDHRAWPVRLALTVNVLPTFQQAVVQRALLAAFGNAAGGFFAFDQRELGADLALSDVYALAESVSGVDHVLATLLHAESDTPQVADRISVPDDALATGGDASDAGVGRLTVQLIGGLS